MNRVTRNRCENVTLYNAKHSDVKKRCRDFSGIFTPFRVVLLRRTRERSPLFSLAWRKFNQISLCAPLFHPGFEDPVPVWGRRLAEKQPAPVKIEAGRLVIRLKPKDLLEKLDRPRKGPSAVGRQSLFK